MDSTIGFGDRFHRLSGGSTHASGKKPRFVSDWSDAMIVQQEEVPKYTSSGRRTGRRPMQPSAAMLEAEARAAHLRRRRKSKSAATGKRKAKGTSAALRRAQQRRMSVDGILHGGDRELYEREYAAAARAAPRPVAHQRASADRRGKPSVARRRSAPKAKAKAPAKMSAKVGPVKKAGAPGKSHKRKAAVAVAPKAPAKKAYAGPQKKAFMKQAMTESNIYRRFIQTPPEKKAVKVSFLFLKP